MVVRVGERIGHLAREMHRGLDRHLPLAIHPLPQRLAFDQGHDVVQQPLHGAGVVERQDVRVMQSGGGLDLGEEALGPEAQWRTRAAGP